MPSLLTLLGGPGTKSPDQRSYRGFPIVPVILLAHTQPTERHTGKFGREKMDVRRHQTSFLNLGHRK